MGASFDFDEVDVVTTGAVGEPGQRVFYLQVRAEGATVSLRCEKQQVAALADYLAELLEDLPQPEAPVPAALLALDEPVVAAWTIGALAVAYEEQSDRLLLVAEELVPEEEAPDPLDTPGVVRARVTRAQVRALVDHARSVVASGREPCRFCGRPKDPAGHVCPRSNGHGLH